MCKTPPTKIAAAAAEAVLRSIPLKHLLDSPTQTRDFYDPEYIAELAADIKSHGRNLSPMLVRPIPGSDDFEIVFGHCRKRGCEGAELTEGWCEIRAMTDLEVKRAQISENLHRNNIKPLAEARGFADLMRDHKVKVEQLIADFGKSKGYIYGRLALLRLCEPVQKALGMGLPVDVAIKIASYGSDSIQQRAMQRVKTPEGAWMSVRDAKARLNSEFTIQLANAPFDLKDEKLFKGAGSCSECPELAANNPELADMPADTCVNKDCYDIKCEEHRLHVVMQLQDEGHSVLQDDDAIRDFSLSGFTPLTMSFAFESRTHKVSDMIAARPEGHPLAKLVYIAPDGEEPRGYIGRADLDSLMYALGLLKPITNAASAAWDKAFPKGQADAGSAEATRAALASQAAQTGPAIDPYAGWTDAERAAVTCVNKSLRLELTRRVMDAQRTAEELRAMALREVEMADGDLGHLSSLLLGLDEFSTEQMTQWVNDATPDQLSAMLAALSADYHLSKRMSISRALPREAAQDRVNLLAAYGINVLDHVEKPAAAQAQAEQMPASPADIANDDPDDEDDDDADPLPVVSTSPSKNAARYRNQATGETWSGRGLQPKWLRAAIAAGGKLNDYVIAEGEA